MTRINLIKPQYLLDQHLMAEYRELPMVNASLRRSLDSPNWPTIKLPKQYTLNTGHVKFFYNKRVFLQERWHLLIAELLRRSFVIIPDQRNVDFSIFDEVPIDAVADAWKPTNKDIKININRILLRVKEKPNWYKYKSKSITYAWYKDRILNKFDGVYNANTR